MKKKFSQLLITALVLFVPVLLQAQVMQFQLAKKNFTDGDYYKALDYFNQAISQEKSGNAEMLTEAHFMRGLTYIRLYSNAFSSENRTEQKKFQDALLDAYKDFSAALKTDNGLYWQKIDGELKNLQHSLLQEGLKSLNQYNDLVFNGKSDPALLKRAEDYLLASHDIKDTYLVNDLLGQVYLDKGMKPEAKQHFLRAIELYTGDLPEEPDFLMAYVFYRLAAIDKTDSIRIALQVTEKGIKLMDSEYDRYHFMKDKLTPDRAKELEDQYNLAMQDLNNIKLDLYLSGQDLYVEALHVFEEELQSKPEDVNLLIGYASLLERSDKQKSMEIYKKVLEIDPENKLATFNMGALYYGKGKELFELAEQEKDSKQYKILTEDAINDFEEARPYFERSLELDSASYETIQALKTIAFILDDQDSYKKYQELEKSLSH